MSPATPGSASRSAAGLTALLVVALEAIFPTNVCSLRWTHIYAGRPTSSRSLHQSVRLHRQRDATRPFRNRWVYACFGSGAEAVE